MFAFRIFPGHYVWFASRSLLRLGVSQAAMFCSQRTCSVAHEPVLWPTNKFYGHTLGVVGLLCAVCVPVCAAQVCWGVLLLPMCVALGLCVFVRFCKHECVRVSVCDRACVSGGVWV